jgi:hypothetical protein
MPPETAQPCRTLRTGCGRRAASVRSVPCDLMNLVWSIAATFAVAWILYRFPGRWLSRRWPAAFASAGLPRLLTACAIFLVPWIGVLITQLHGQTGKRSFASSWIGLDVMEICGLLLTAVLLRRRARAASPVAAATATLLVADAWFDFMSAAPKLEYAQAMLLAVVIELPLAAILAWASRTSLGWGTGAAGQTVVAAEPGCGEPP